MINLIRAYGLNVLLWLDIGCNVILFGGSPYETMSSRAGKRAAAGDVWACKFCAFLSKVLGPHHCENSSVPDYGKTIDWWKPIIQSIRNLFRR